MHSGQSVTRARLRNPGKYTDNSLRQAHSKRSRARERSASLTSVVSRDQRVGGTCVNESGTIKPCRNLVTRMNFRATHVLKDRLPLQMLYAMLLDEQPEIVRTYDEHRVRYYLAGVVGRSLEPGESEPPGWKNLYRFAVHTINLLSQVKDMRGDVDPIVVLAERYLDSHPTIENGYQTIWNSIRHGIADLTPATILDNLKTLVYEVVPNVRLWSYDKASPTRTGIALLRRGQSKTHPWDQLKRDLERSIELFAVDNGPPFEDRPPERREGNRARGRGRPGTITITGTRTRTRTGAGTRTRMRAGTRTGARTAISRSPEAALPAERRARIESPARARSDSEGDDPGPPPPTPGRFLNAAEDGSAGASGERPDWLRLADELTP